MDILVSDRIKEKARISFYDREGRFFKQLTFENSS